MESYYQSFNNRKLLPASLFVRMRHRKIKWIAEDHSATRWQRQEQNCNLPTLHPALIWTGKRKSIPEARIKRERFVFKSAENELFQKEQWWQTSLRGYVKSGKILKEMKWCHWLLHSREMDKRRRDVLFGHLLFPLRYHKGDTPTIT